MSKLETFQPESPVFDGVIKAHLLLSKPYGDDIDSLSAAFFASIGLPPGSLQKAFKDNDARKLVLQTEQCILTVATTDTPLGAEYFNKAIPPMLTAAERSAFISVIGGHEAAIFLKLEPKTAMAGTSPILLHKAITTISRKTNLLGLLWGPTRRLHQRDGLHQILNTDTPMSLFLAPVQKTIGAKDLKVIEFPGARHLLGYDLSLHMGHLNSEQAVEAGLAFAQHCFENPDFQNQASFQHEGKTFRLLQQEGHISLRPVAHFGSKALQALESEVKTAA